MPTVIHIDGPHIKQRVGSVTIEQGTTLPDALDGLGANWHVEHRPVEERERMISTDAASFIASYEREDPSAVLAVFWRYHSLEAEEFDAVAG
jgi:hypothetical protein